MQRSPRFFLQHDSDAPETLQIGGTEIVVYSRRCPTKETVNEDAAAIIPVGDHSFVMVVADGVGGYRGGEEASNLTLQQLAETIASECQDPALLRISILDGIERANSAILAQNSKACTTLAAIEFNAGEIRPYHVGDYMILVCGQRNRVHYQTVSHSPVGFAVESGMLSEDDALQHDKRNLVSNVVGDEQMRIELGPPMKLARRDTVLIASDGLFDNLRVDEIVSTICSGSLTKSVEQLVKQARNRMTNPTSDVPSKPDDLTICALRRTSES